MNSRSYMGFLMIALVGLFATGCGAKKVKFSNETGTACNVASCEGVKARLLWVKIRGARAEMEVSLSNEYDHTVYLAKNSLKFNWNGENGTTQAPSFDRRIVNKTVGTESVPVSKMASGDRFTQLISFYFDGKPSPNGTGSLLMDQIYKAAPSNGDSAAADESPLVALPLLKLAVQLD